MQIPYVLPQGWRCVAHEVHVLRAITDPACDYHRVKPLPAEFTFQGGLRQGYMLRVKVPLASALPGWNGSSLQLALAFELAREVPAEVLEQAGDGHTEADVSGLTASAAPPSSAK